MILCLMIAKLAYRLTLNREESLLDHKVKVIQLVFISASPAKYSMNHVLDNYLSWCSGCLIECIIHCIYAAFVIFAPGGIYVA